MDDEETQPKKRWEPAGSTVWSDPDDDFTAVADLVDADDPNATMTVDPDDMWAADEGFVDDADHTAADHTAVDHTAVQPPVQAPQQPHVPAPAPAAAPPRPPATRGPAETPANGSKRTGWFVAIGVLVVFVLAAGVAVLIAGRDDDQTAATTTAADTTTTTAPVIGPKFALGDTDVTVIAPSGSLDSGATVDGTKVSMPGGLTSMFTPVSTVVDAEVVNGNQTGPIDLIFPIDTSSALGPDGGAPVLVALHDHDGVLSVLPGTFSKADSTYRVQVNEFSVIGIATWKWSKVEQGVTKSLDAVTGTANQANPYCSNTDDDTTTIDTSGEVVWCVDVATDGTRSLRGVNRNRFAVQLSWEGTAQVSVDTSSSSELLADLRSAVEDSTHRIIGPGETVEVVIAGADEATITTDFAGGAAAATWLLVEGRVMSTASEFIPDAERPGGGDYVLDALASTGCASSAATASDTAGAVFDACFTIDAVTSQFGDVARPYLDQLLPALRTMVTAEAADRTDGFAGEAASTVAVTAQQAADPTWPTSDDEARGRIRSALEDDDDRTFTWSSCSAKTCIAGDGSQVVILKEEGKDVRQIGDDIDQDTPDPLTALMGEGLREDDARALLEPT